MTYLNPALFTTFDCYEMAREDSEKLDLLLGVQVKEIEQLLLQKAQSLAPQGDIKTWGASLHEGNQTWVGLSHQTLQTPYSELKKMCELIKPEALSTVVDLGAGYGRMGLILKAFYPEVQFLGYEYVIERVREGQRILDLYDCQKAVLKQQDLTEQEFELPLAEYYFVYDYGTVPHLRKTLKQFEKLADRHMFKLIARGKGIRSLIQHEHPWLTNLCPPIHEENFSIYSMD